MIDLLKELFKQFPMWLKTLVFAFLVGLLGYIACIAGIPVCQDYWWIALVILGLIIFLLVVSGIILSIINYVRKNYVGHNKKDDNSKRVNAYVFDLQDAKERDAMFNDIDNMVQHTYWVLGSSLHSLTTEKGENSIKQLIDKNVTIKFIMMDPNISSSHLFCNNEDMCHIYKYINDNIKDTVIKEDLINSLKIQFKNYKDKTQKLVVLNNHLNSYFSAINYKQRIDASYAALESIRENLDPNQVKIEARKTQTLMSVSLTIIDAEFDNGCMIAEFHLPFTQSRVMLKLSKMADGRVFNSLVDFYNKVLDNSEPITLN